LVRHSKSFPLASAGEHKSLTNMSTGGSQLRPGQRQQQQQQQRRGAVCGYSLQRSVSGLSAAHHRFLPSFPSVLHPRSACPAPSLPALCASASAQCSCLARSSSWSSCKALHCLALGVACPVPAPASSAHAWCVFPRRLSALAELRETTRSGRSAARGVLN
jgi:hypothetical protein